MTEKPINLHAHEARAASDGRLGLVVRPLVPQPRLGRDGGGAVISSDYYVWDRKPNATDEHSVIPVTEECWRMSRICPIGQPGDRLWGREVWCAGEDIDGPYILYPNTGTREYWELDKEGDYIIDICDRCAEVHNGWRQTAKRSSTQMPRLASRFTFEVEAVECRLVQDIDRDDSQSQFAMGGCEDGIGWTFMNKPWQRHAIDAFEDAWNHHYAKRGLGWDANPWAWFGRVRRAEG